MISYAHHSVHSECLLPLCHRFVLVSYARRASEVGLLASVFDLAEQVTEGMTRMLVFEDL